MRPAFCDMYMNRFKRIILIRPEVDNIWPDSKNLRHSARLRPLRTPGLRVHYSESAAERPPFPLPSIHYFFPTYIPAVSRPHCGIRLFHRESLCILSPVRFLSFQNGLFLYRRSMSCMDTSYAFSSLHPFVFVLIILKHCEQFKAVSTNCRKTALPSSRSAVLFFCCTSLFSRWIDQPSAGFLFRRIARIAPDMAVISPPRPVKSVVPIPPV